jgi:dolichyl-phosphate beta-glucosyltransferase
VAEEVDLSVIVPAYNEERRLPGTLHEISRHLAATGFTYEIIVVDDGSTDETGDVTSVQAQSDPCVQLLMTRHAGKGAAVRSGAQAARGRRVLFCDADLPMAAEDLTRLAAMLGDHDVVIASREGLGASRIGEPYYRHLMGRVFNGFVQLLAVPGIQDTQCGLKCFTDESARRVFSMQTLDGFGFDVEILFVARKLGYRIHQVPITWSHRDSSRVDPIRDTLRMLADILRVRWNDFRGVYHH